MTPARVSAVLPTYDRTAALAETFPQALAIEDVDEVLVVDDGSRENVRDVVGRWPDARVRVLRHDRNRGVTAARNTGAAAATGEWLLFLEDDCYFPHDYAQMLLEEARRQDADVVGAPMVHRREGETLDQAVARTRRERGGDGGLDGVARFPVAAVETPLLQAPALVRRSLWERLRFDDAYVGNAYREETDFFVRAARTGARCVLTPRTWFAEAGRWPGGQPRHPLRAEWWTWRNNWLFLRRHESWLVEQALVRSAVREQAAFAARRLTATARRRPQLSRRVIDEVLRRHAPVPLEALIGTTPPLLSAADVLGQLVPDLPDLAPLLAEHEEVESELERRLAEQLLRFPATYRVERELRLLLHLLVRVLRPRNVVETGVADGVSSLVLLRALERNGSGALRSLDISEEAGGLVPPELRRGWELRVLGSRDREGLEQALAGVDAVDLFVHDSDHRRAWQALEYGAALARLRPGGILLSDDVDASHAWVELRRRTGRRGALLFDGRTFAGVMRP